MNFPLIPDTYKLEEKQLSEGKGASTSPHNLKAQRKTLWKFKKYATV